MDAKKLKNSSTTMIMCSNNVVSSYIILDVLIVVSYFYCLYLFSKSETEYLLRLAENVSMSSVCNSLYGTTLGGTNFICY